MERLCHLYSERNFEEKETIEFWKAKLQQYCLKNNTFAFNPNDIPAAFTIHDLYPSSFAKCLPILKLNDQIVKKKSEMAYSKTDLQQYLITSAFNLTKSILSIGATEEELACIPLLEEASKMLQNYMRNLKDCDCVVLLHSTDPLRAGFTFCDLANKAGRRASDVSKSTNILNNLSEESTTLLAHYLLLTGRAALSEDQTIIKVLKPSATPSSSSSSGLFGTVWSLYAGKTVNSVEEGEEAVLRLRMSIAQLETKVGELEAKAEQHRQAAIKYKVSIVLPQLCSAKIVIISVFGVIEQQQSEPGTLSAGSAAQHSAGQRPHRRLAGQPERCIRGMVVCSVLCVRTAYLTYIVFCSFFCPQKIDSAGINRVITGDHCHTR